MKGALLLADYIAQLRRCVSSGIQHSSKHFESCAFWKDLYETSEAAQRDLIDRVYECDQRIEQLQSDLCRSKATDVQAGVKRKRSVNPATIADSNRRKISTNVKKSDWRRERRLEVTTINCEENEELGNFQCSESLWSRTHH